MWCFRFNSGLSGISACETDLAACMVLDGLRGESSIAELWRRGGIAESLYYAWSKEFLEAGKRRLAGDTARAATSSEVKDLRREAQEFKVVVAEQALELRLLKKV